VVVVGGGAVVVVGGGAVVVVGGGVVVVVLLAVGLGFGLGLALCPGGQQFVPLEQLRHTPIPVAAGVKDGPDANTWAAAERADAVAGDPTDNCKAGTVAPERLMTRSALSTVPVGARRLFFT
jgi:hypothetical protein